MANTSLGEREGQVVRFIGDAYRNDKLPAREIARERERVLHHTHTHTPYNRQTNKTTSKYKV